MREIRILKDEAPDNKIWIIKLLMLTGIAESKREARQIVSRGMIYIDTTKISTSDCDVDIFTGLIVEKKSIDSVRICIEEN